MARHLSDATLSRYADGDLSKVEKGRVAEHLSRCVACSARFTEICHIKDVAGNLEQIEVPPELFVGVRARIAASRSVKSWGLWKGIILGVAASAAIALLVLSPHGAPTGSTEPAILMVPAEEPLGPPLGLANARNFGQSSQVSGTETANVHLAAYEEPEEYDTIILIPLDEKARQNMINAKRNQLPPFRQKQPNGTQGGLVTVGETFYE
jgi:hypothetical protein